MVKDFIVEQTGERLDRYLADLLPNFSRSQIAQWIREGQVLVDNHPVKASYRVTPAEHLRVYLPDEVTDPEPQPKPMPLTILYEDDDLLAINKTRDLVVHPAPGHWQDTLVNGLLAHCEQLADTGDDSRPGIVHRLDKDTTGLLIVAKTDRMYQQLQEMFAAGLVKRYYRALVWGQPQSERGIIDAPIGRHHQDRKKMAVTATGREAMTGFEVMARFRRGSELRLELHTGRTHQIRVHLKYIGCPVIGDRTYTPKRPDLGLSGQALHACRISFPDPRHGQEFALTCPPPADYLAAREQLAQL